ncbi:MAG: nucleotidyltransferase domain-containing protein [Acidobacteria bacterium]|nr:nucleotidyltransferase domain-containing protein [Acidobacteriota bacterium]
MRTSSIPTPREGRRPVASDIDKLTKMIVEATDEPPEEVLLFGSAARETMTETSDLDFAIVKETRNPQADERRIRRGLPRNRAVDVVVASRLIMTSEATSRISWATAAILEGIVLFRNGRHIGYETAHRLKTKPGASMPLKLDEPGDNAQHTAGEAWTDLRWAILRAGRSDAAKAGPPGALARHHVRHIASRSGWFALTAEVLKSGRWPGACDDLTTLVGLLPAGARAKQIPRSILERLDSGRRRWLFKGEPPPTMAEALEAIENANTVFDHVTVFEGEEKDWVDDERNRLRNRLIARVSGPQADRKAEQKRQLDCQWPPRPVADDTQASG